MGRIKSTLIKRTSKQLLKDEGLFNDKFEHNKKILGSTMPSKKTRNKIAGYMARLVRAKLDAEKRAQRKAKRDAEAKIAAAQATQDYQFQ